jgi:amino-acid N-acetyltransferase
MRSARAGDWPAIEALLAACGLPREGARDHLAGFRVVERDGVVIACAGLERHGDHGLLRSLAVAAPARGEGHGDALLSASLAEARAAGLRDVSLLTTTAADYFAARGFARVAREALPAALAASAELRGACPASAIAMKRDLPGAPGDGTC